MPVTPNRIDDTNFNRRIDLPFELRLQDFQMAIQDVYDFFYDLGQVTIEDFRRNPRGELGTRTATLHKEGIRRFRENWVYRVE
ncbi:MAG: hypothetical protein OXI92_04960 [Acidobacteriota bacterium]|nr:hypothetical protein [Acidobacteriota bacterium]